MKNKKVLAALVVLIIPVLAHIRCGDSNSTDNGQVESIVFDIDGTLTTDSSAFFTARPDSPKAVQMYVDKGYAVIYLTARPKFLEGFTRNWLANNGFPDLPLYLADGILITDEQTVNFKIGVLSGLINDENRIFVYGYGDSSTDFDSYNAVGIPIEKTFALLREGDTDCQEGQYETCLTGYTGHLPYIEDQPRAN